MNSTVNSEWLRLLNSILTDGVTVSPRNMVTLELIGVTSKIPMNNPVLTIGARKISYRFMVAEAAWILNGDNKVSTIEPYCRQMSQYSDDGIFLAGAYGPRIKDQLPYILACFEQDIQSRQAIIQVWRTCPNKSKDIPCTVSIQFLIRNNKIHTIVNMRSSDTWLGWPYDVFNFSMLTTFVLLHLKKFPKTATLELGELTLTTGSQHIYEHTVLHARQCIMESSKCWNCNPIKTSEFKAPDDLIQHLQALRDNYYEGCNATFMMEKQTVERTKYV